MAGKKMEKVGEKSPHLPGVEESDILEVNIMKKAEDFPPGALGLSVWGGGARDLAWIVNAG